MYDSSEKISVRNILTEKHRDLTENFVTWCNDIHLKLSVSKTNELVMDYMLQILILQQRSYNTVSRWAPEIRVTNQVTDQM